MKDKKDNYILKISKNLIKNSDNTLRLYNDDIHDNLNDVILFICEIYDELYNDIIYLKAKSYDKLMI